MPDDQVQEVPEDDKWVDLVVYEIIETDTSYALSMQSSIDESASHLAGKAFITSCGEKFPSLLGGYVIVQGKAIETNGVGYLSARTLWPEASTIDEATVHTAVNALLTTLVANLMPEAQLAGFGSRQNGGYLN